MYVMHYMYVCMSVSQSVCMYVYVCMYVRTYVNMYVYFQRKQQQISKK